MVDAAYSATSVPANTLLPTICHASRRAATTMSTGAAARLAASPSPCVTLFAISSPREDGRISVIRRCKRQGPASRKIAGLPSRNAGYGCPTGLSSPAVTRKGSEFPFGGSGHVAKLVKAHGGLYD